MSDTPPPGYDSTIPPDPPASPGPARPRVYKPTGRIYVADERDADWTMERVLPKPGGTPHGRILRASPVRYDQGQTPDCTAYSTATAESIHWAAYAGPEVTFNADRIYGWANANDGLPQPHDGSTVRAAFTAWTTIGGQVLSDSAGKGPRVGADVRPASYLWADLSDVTLAVDHLISWLLVIGPVTVGTPWYESMFCQDPDSGQFIAPAGGIAPVVADQTDEGHAYTIRGVNADDPDCLFVVRNTWRPWGVTVHDDWSVDTVSPDGGDIVLRRDDLEALLSDQGEAGALVADVVR